ncbi:MAG TPA: GNAT family N-acetyltransferase, partial [Usitatibacter sp.]
MASVAATSAIAVRPALPADREALSSLYRRCRMLAEWLPAPERSRSDFDRDTRGEKIWVAVGEGGGIDGFVALWERDSFIHHLYVLPEARRQGVASALLDALAGHFPLPWRLKCVRLNSVALDFYSKRGWKEV